MIVMFAFARSWCRNTGICCCLLLLRQRVLDLGAASSRALPYRRFLLFDIDDVPAEG